MRLFIHGSRGGTGGLDPPLKNHKNEEIKCLSTAFYHFFATSLTDSVIEIIALTMCHMILTVMFQQAQTHVLRRQFMCTAVDAWL